MDGETVEILKSLHQQSRCPRRQIAAVFYDKEWNVLAYGFNCREDGVDCFLNPCDELRSKRGCKASHAEDRAFQMLKTHPLRGSEPFYLVCSRSPCMHCAKNFVVPSGVKEMHVLTYNPERRRDVFLERNGIVMVVK